MTTKLAIVFDKTEKNTELGYLLSPNLEEIELSKADFIEMKKEAQKNNAKFMVFMIPSRNQINAGKEMFYIQEVFSRFFEEQNITYFDSTRYLLNSSYYLEKNGHWNEKGTEVAGKLLAKELKEQKLI